MWIYLTRSSSPMLMKLLSLMLLTCTKSFHHQTVILHADQDQNHKRWHSLVDHSAEGRALAKEGRGGDFMSHFTFAMSMVGGHLHGSSDLTKDRA